MGKRLTYEEAISFRDQFRLAQAVALRDAEGFTEVIHVLERLGMFMLGRQAGLGKYAEPLAKLAVRSPLSQMIEDSHLDPELHGWFENLFDSVRDARNDAMHQGAIARHLTSHAVKVALVLEDALMHTFDQVRDFMVFHPVCAALWQPVSFVRQTMLENSFSHLPVSVTSGSSIVWKLVSEETVAKYLRVVNADVRKQRLVKSLEEAEKDMLVLASDVKTCNAEDAVSEVVTKLNGEPVLVLRKGSSDLIGILTAYDLL